MKPDDNNAKLPIDQRPFRVLIISGSQRRQYNCPGADSKSRALMLKMAEMLPQQWEIDYEDLGNVFGRERIQPCNACVSTSMALCVWPCNCYSKNNNKEADLMWNLDLYARLDMADAWAIIGPINWYGPSSNLKLMFDRLVCMNGGNPDEKLIDHKDPQKAIELESSDQWSRLSLNHLEGRTAAFFCYGDMGGDELDDSGRPKILHHKKYFDPDTEPFENERDAYAPLVWQCRYGGIEVPDHLWKYGLLGKGKTYSEYQAEHMIDHPEFMREFYTWTEDFVSFVKQKGKVRPNQYRAYEHIPRAHGWANVKDGVKYFRMMIGKPVADTSPAIQQELNLNKDVTLHPQKGEGKNCAMNKLIHKIMDKRGAPILVATFLALLAFETISSLRKRKEDRLKRTFINSIFSIQGFLTLRLLLLPAMVWVAYKNQRSKFGLNYLYNLDPMVKAVIGFLLLDYSNYLWHKLNHRSSLLWRFHLVHHTDLDLDVSTAIRFHGGELVFSVFYRSLAVLLTGASPMLVLVYEICFEGATQFHHSNWKLPFGTERALNKIFVTPRMHGIHHSVIRNETDSNFSVIFSFWDRIGRTMNLNIPQKDIIIGVPVYQNPDELKVADLIKLPFTTIREWKKDVPARGKEDNKSIKP